MDWCIHQLVDFFLIRYLKSPVVEARIAFLWQAVRSLSQRLFRHTSEKHEDDKTMVGEHRAILFYVCELLS